MSDLARKLNSIHERLLAGRPTASLELFEASLKPLIGFVRREFRMTEEEAYDHAVDAVVSHTTSPDTFDPSRSSLWTFLCLVAQRNVQDARRKGKNRGELTKKYGYGIELWGVQSNKPIEAVENAKDAETIMTLHGHTIAKNETERKVLDLFLAGETEVALYADAIGLGDSADAAAQIKRVQDRLKLRLKKVRDEL